MGKLGKTPQDIVSTPIAQEIAATTDKWDYI
jgi:hypothetical protein